nr:PREDICTED: jerky protein homolog-like [Megachile rotundata]
MSIGLCANANRTHKLPPILIHKYKSQRALKNSNELPPSVRQYQLENGVVGKVILLVDNCSSRKDMEPEEMFEIMYLPPNTTSLIQTTDQSVIAKFKTLYRHQILRRILQYEKGIEEFYKSFNTKDCTDLVNKSWMDITPINIYNSWSKILPRDNKDEDETNPNILNISIHSSILQLEALRHSEDINKNDADEDMHEERGEEEEKEESETEYEEEEQDTVSRVISSGDYNTIDELITVLKSRFAPLDTSYQLYGNLSKMAQMPNEAVVGYSSRVSSLPLQIKNCNEIEQPKLAQQYNKTTETNAVRTFLTGLRPEIYGRLRSHEYMSRLF